MRICWSLTRFSYLHLLRQHNGSASSTSCPCRPLFNLELDNCRLIDPFPPRSQVFRMQHWNAAYRGLLPGFPSKRVCSSNTNQPRPAQPFPFTPTTAARQCKGSGRMSPTSLQLPIPEPSSPRQPPWASFMDSKLSFNSSKPLRPASPCLPST